MTFLTCRWQLAHQLYRKTMKEQEPLILLKKLVLWSRQRVLNPLAACSLRGSQVLQNTDLGIFLCIPFSILKNRLHYAIFHPAKDQTRSLLHTIVLCSMANPSSPEVYRAFKANQAYQLRSPVRSGRTASAGHHPQCKVD